MPKNPKGHRDLSRRERQMMDVVYRFGGATAAEVLEHLADPPSYSAVRATLRILVEKGHLTHREIEGQRYVYEPTVPRDEASRTALRKLLDTFFGGSVEGAVQTLLDLESDEITTDELERLQTLIDEAKAKEST